MKPPQPKDAHARLDAFAAAHVVSKHGPACSVCRDVPAELLAALNGYYAKFPAGDPVLRPDHAMVMGWLADEGVTMPRQRLGHHYREGHHVRRG